MRANTMHFWLLSSDTSTSPHSSIQYNDNLSQKPKYFEGRLPDSVSKSESLGIINLSP